MHSDNINLTREQKLSLQDGFEHKQVEVKVNGKSFTVDEGLEEIIYNLNKYGMCTRNSCIDNFGKVWIHFWTYLGFKVFFCISFNYKPLWDFFQKNMEITLHSADHMKMTPNEHTITEIMEILRDKIIEREKARGYDEKVLKKQIDDIYLSKYWRSPISIRFPKELLDDFKPLFFEALALLPSPNIKSAI